MSTKTHTTIQTSSSRTVPTLPRQRTNPPTRRPQGKVSLAIVTVLAAGVGAAALWLGVGSEDAVEAPPLVPAQVQQNTDTSANAFEHDLVQRKLGQVSGSTGTFEQDLLGQKLGQGSTNVGSGQQTATPPGQSSANAVEHNLSFGPSVEEWTMALKHLNNRARAQAQGQ